VRSSIVSWLSSRGAGEIDHPGGSLLEHLVRTADTLSSWGADEHLQAVGLLHATYGTDGFARGLATLGERAVICDVASPAVEADVYLYGSCDRAATYPRLARGDRCFVDRFTGEVVAVDVARTCRFVELTAANEIDVFEHNRGLRSAHGAEVATWLSSCARFLSSSAITAWDAFAVDIVRT
jgi:hypothetical protein